MTPPRRASSHRLDMAACRSQEPPPPPVPPDPSSETRSMVHHCHRRLHFHCSFSSGLDPPHFYNFSFSIPPLHQPLNITIATTLRIRSIPTATSIVDVERLHLARFGHSSMVSLSQVPRIIVISTHEQLIGLASLLCFWGSVWVIILPWIKDVSVLPQVVEGLTKLPQYEDVKELPHFEEAIELFCSEFIELPCFEAFANGLARFCVSGLVFFETFRNSVPRALSPKIKSHLQAQPTQELTQAYVDSHKSITFKVSATRRYISSVSIAESLVIKSAFNAAHSLVLRHINVSYDTHSLVALLRSTGVTNELKIILLDTYCHLDVFSFLSLPYVSRLEVIEVSRLEFIEVGSITKSAMCNVNSSSTFGV